MSTGEAIGAIVIALLIAGIFYYGFKSRGPWGSFWTFTLVIVFGVLIAAVWARPIGPIWWGIAWFPLFFFGLLFALLLAAATPTATRTEYRRAGYIDRTDIDRTDTEMRQTEPIGVRAEPVDERADDEEAAAVGIFFWAMLVLFLGLVVAGIAVA